MDVKEAAQAAKEYVLDLFSDEIIGGVSLEEVEFDDGYPKRWKITVSFIRTPRRPSSTLQGMASAIVGDQLNYRVVDINDDTGRVKSVRHRSLG